MPKTVSVTETDAQRITWCTTGGSPMWKSMPETVTDIETDTQQLHGVQQEAAL